MLSSHGWEEKLKLLNEMEKRLSKKLRNGVGMGE
jgi:hypothetical protein